MGTVIRTIASLKRLTNTRMGNPRYVVTFTDGTTMRTRANSYIAAVIENSEYRDVPLIVETTPAGTISDLTPVPSTYETREINKVGNDDLRMKITGSAGESRWLTLTVAQRDAISLIMSGS